MASIQIIRVNIPSIRPRILPMLLLLTGLDFFTFIMGVLLFGISRL